MNSQWQPVQTTLQSLSGNKLLWGQSQCYCLKSVMIYETIPQPHSQAIPTPSFQLLKLT